MLRIINKEEHEQIVKSLNEKGENRLNRQLAYLLTYADPGKSRDEMAPIRVFLFADFKGMGYGVVWERLNPDTFTYDYWMNGGLVYFESDNTWSVHT